MTAYYNEIDPKKAAWLRELITRNLIAPGEVDERSITDVRPDDLVRFTQCHFFAGIGVWSYALRCAGWPDDRAVWTGSCPCQPFSAAGSREGFADDRHLWPEWARLVRECQPGVVFGEQVASPDGLVWLDLVHADLEGAGYAVAAADLCAAGIGAPHKRQRLYFVADTERGRYGRVGHGPRGRRELIGGSESGPLAHPDGGDTRAEREQRSREQRLLPQDGGVGAGVALGDTGSARLAQQRGERGASPGEGSASQGEAPVGTGAPTPGFWSAVDWLPCTDGKARPVEPGTFPLAHGAPERVVRLRGYGDGIVAPLAEEFVRAYLDLN